MLRSFSDRQWPGVGIQPQPVARAQPRSIPLLANVPMRLRVKETGALSPGWAIGELEPTETAAYTVTFRAVKSTTFMMRVLRPGTGTITDTVQIDGETLAWQSLPEEHPDIRLTAMQIAAGTHTLSLHGSKSTGLTFSILQTNLELPTLPLRPGRNVGRRMLLAEPVAQPETVVSSTTDGLDLTFTATASDAASYAILELDRTVHGRLAATFDGPAGTTIAMGWDERLFNGKRPLPYPGSLHPQWNQTDAWVLDGTPRPATTIDARAGRYLLVTAWGGGPIHLRDVVVHEERYPNVQRGAWESQDRRLNRIWQVGVDTIYPNMTDAYADPWRERGQWWGDAYVADRTNQIAFGDTALLRRGLSLMAEAIDSNGRPRALAPQGQGNYMLDYAMLWVQSTGDYWRQTGDATVPAEIYPAISAFMQHLAGKENAETFLIDLPFGHWSQTVYIETLGYNNRYGQSTAVNALYYDTLLSAAELADATGHEADATAWRTKANLVKQQVNALLYQPSEGRYSAALRVDGTIQPTPQAQAWALAFGLVPEAQVEQVVAVLLELLSDDPAAPNVEIFGMYWVLEALGRSGHVAEGIELIKKYYGHMLDRGATTWWEGFNADDNYFGSLSHGWGGAPTWFLTTYALGARRTGPMSWQLRTKSSLRNLRGALPLAEGALSLAWNSQVCAQQTLEIGAPDGATGEIVLPNEDPSLVLKLNGTLVWQGGKAMATGIQARQKSLFLAIPGGNHTLDVTGACHAVYVPLIAR